MEIKQVLKEQLLKISPSKEELGVLSDKAKEILNILKTNIRKSKTSAEVFVGGSFAKKTIIKKDDYDIDIFIRFNKKYDEKQIAKHLVKIVPKNAEKLHGSRDYYRIKSEDIAGISVEFEIIPVVAVKKPELARNITDLSYFHVNYVTNKIKKNPKLKDEIKIAKAFIHYSGCYGAESYINGFSGYAVELLVINYGSFLNFIKAVLASKLDERKKEKIILDPGKKFKNKNEIMKELNESKLFSPIILVDPTYKQRNALAALSYETFYKFREYCAKFLKHPSSDFFIEKDIEANFLKKNNNKASSIIITTKKQAGDIAGTKLKKFYGFFLAELKRFFEVRDSEFIYDDKNNIGKILLVFEQKKEIVFSGPPIKMKEPLACFKKEHKKIKIIKGKAYAYEKSIDFNEFLNNFMNQKRKIIEEMDVEEIKVS